MESAAPQRRSDVSVTSAADELRVRGSLRRSATSRERLAQYLYERLHPVMGALGLLFLVMVLAQSAARDGTTLHRVLLVGTWVLWSAFVAEYLLRLAIAPSSGVFLRRTWWQLLFFAVPFLTMFRFLLVLRVARPTRVAIAAIRGGRSARRTMTGRTGWLGVVTAIVVFAAADLLYESGIVSPYGRALHAAALAAVTGEPIGSHAGLAEVLDIALAIYAVVFFASLAGIFGAFFMEQRSEARNPNAPTTGLPTSAE